MDMAPPGAGEHVDMEKPPPGAGEHEDMDKPPSAVSGSVMTVTFSL